MDEIITAPQVAIILKVHVKTVYRLAKQGLIPGSRIGGSWRFSIKDVLELVSKGERGGVTGAGSSPDDKWSFRS